jgi:alpha-galactosidase
MLNLVASFVMASAPFAGSGQENSVHLEDLNLSSISQEWGDPMKNKSVDGAELSVGGVKYSSGIGTHAVSSFKIQLHKKAVSLSVSGGLDDEATPHGSVVFEIWVDGKRVAESPVMRKGMPAAALQVNLKGAERLELHVSDAGDGNDNDHADWLNPVITTLPGGAAGIVSQAPAPAGPPPVIAHGFGPKAKIHGPRVIGCSTGKPFMWKVPATGTKPLKYLAAGLPEGLSIDSNTGIISGSVQNVARTAVKLEVVGPKSRDTRVVFIDSHGMLALTPPMGWNSWNVWGTSVTAQKVKDAADAMIKSGLADYGYAYVNIDDAWEGPRGNDGIITTNEKFGNMKQLADSLHAAGIHLGIYSSPGPTTCAGYPASYKFEKQDADTYANWGVDYLKYDWCSYGEIAPRNPGLLDYEKPYVLMHDMLKASSRDIVFSLCQYGMGDVWGWGRRVGGNLWRTTGDITDTWSSMTGNGFQGSKWVHGAEPGSWNDPDMLVVGNLGWGDHPRPTRLTPNEQLVHLSLWSLLASPLLLGCDLTKLDKFTLDELTNDDVLDVDQDPMGRAATRIGMDGQKEVWARPLYDGGWAVGLFNRGDQKETMSFSLRELGLHGKHVVRDLWKMKDVATITDEFKASVPVHGVVFVKVMP